MRCVCVCLQSLSVAINECLTERLVLRDGLENGAFLRHVAYGPLPQASAAQTEDVTARRGRSETQCCLTVQLN